MSALVYLKPVPEEGRSEVLRTEVWRTEVRRTKVRMKEVKMTEVTRTWFLLTVYHHVSL